MSDLTQLLREWGGGDRSNERALFAEIYPVLRGIAHRQLGSISRRNMTLQATEIAHEGFMRLFSQERTDWQTRGQFYSLAATVVRRVVIDYLRERSTEKRGSDVEKVSLSVITDSDMPGAEDGAIDWLSLDQSLLELAEFDAASAKVVELRYFVGLTVAEIAVLHDCSPSTIERQWRSARAWLHLRLQQL
jgi:RNA polymerase sigma factor (TIGR02999 family)